MSTPRKPRGQSWLFYDPAPVRPYCATCRHDYRGSSSVHASTRGHVKASQPRIVRRTRFAMMERARPRPVSEDPDAPEGWVPGDPTDLGGDAWSEYLAANGR